MKQENDLFLSRYFSIEFFKYFLVNFVDFLDFLSFSDLVWMRLNIFNIICLSSVLLYFICVPTTG